MKKPHIRNVDLNLLKVFDAVYRERQTTRAADVLAMSQSAVSHALARLRRLFDDPLFTRGPDGMQPTPLATRVAVPIADAMARVGSALATGHAFDPRTSDATFRIAMSDVPAAFVLPRLCRRLESDAPGINLRIRPLLIGSRRFTGLESGEIDMLIVPSSQGTAPNLPHDLEEQLLVEDKLACVIAGRGEGRGRGRSGGGRGAGERLTLQRYAAMSHVAYSTVDDFNSFIDQTLAEGGLRRRIAMTVPYWPVIPHVVEGSDLVWTTMSRLAREAIRGRDLRVVPAPLPPWRHTVTMVWHRRSTEDSAHRWLRTLIHEVTRA